MSSLPTKIFPNLFLGDIFDAMNEMGLMQLGITHILSVGRHTEDESDDFEYLILEPVLDMPDQDLTQYFDKTYKFIEKARRDGAVLVHW